ncbi:MAG: MFS transporter [Chloroflexota bacterium]|nr:MFS transporter [Chloroflexota bacterium]
MSSADNALTAAPTDGEDSAGAVLRNRRFLALWIAQVVTQVGANMVLFGLTVEVFTLTGKSTSVSLLILSYLVPAVIFGAIAGVYTDRNDRRLILVVTNAARGVMFLVLLLVGSNLALIYLLTVLISTLTTFFGPAEAAMIPVIVTRRQLLAANSLYLLTFQGSFFVGFALLGPLVVNVAGQNWLLILVSATYLVGAALCLFLPRNNPRIGGPRPVEALGEAGTAVRTTFGELVDGVRYMLANRQIFWPLAYLALTASLIGVLGVLGPGFATQVLGLTERDFVVVVLPLGIGLVFGILALNVYGKLFSRRRGIEAGLIGLGITLLALSLAQPLVTRFSIAVPLLSIVIAVAFAAGVAYAMVAVPAQTQLQEELPENVRGRVFGVLNMLVSIASFLPIIIVGPIADVVGTPVVVQGAALVTLLVAVGSIMRAHPSHEALASEGVMIDAVDPVSLSGRSLTSPRNLRGPSDDETEPELDDR